MTMIPGVDIVSGPEVRQDNPLPDDWGLVVRVVGGVVIVGPIHVIVDSSALPAGAATEATLAEMEEDIDAIEISTASLDAKTVHVDTDNVTVIASALPAGAATEATLAEIGADIDAIEISSAATAVATASLDAKTVHVDTGNVTVVASALPTGAATEATLAEIGADIDAIEISVASLDAKTMNDYCQKQIDLTSVPQTFYIGYADIGASTADPVWAISRIQFDTAGNPINVMWSTKVAVWDDRFSTVYS